MLFALFRISPKVRKLSFTVPTLPHMPDLAEYMTTKEAAQELGFTIPGVHKLIKRAELELLPVGRIYLVSRKSVKAYQDKTQGASKNNPTRGKTSNKVN